MSGTVLRILEKTNFTASASALHRIAQRVDVSAWTEAQVVTRVHAMDAATGTISLKIYADGFTNEEPSTEFVSPAVIKTVTVSDLAAGEVDVTDLGPGFGPMILFDLDITYSQDTIDADISVDLSLKD